MSQEEPTWREKQQEHQHSLAECAAQSVALREQVAASQQRLEALEARIQAKKGEYNYWLFHWLLNCQLKQLSKQRQQIKRTLDKLDELDETRQKLEEVVKEAPPVRFQRERIIYLLPAETFFFLLLIGLGEWLVTQWWLHG